jgi:hypothetical protein
LTTKRSSTACWKQCVDDSRRAAVAADTAHRQVALRMLVLKHLKSWSYEQLQWEVTGNLVFRYFCRIDGGKVPDAKTMVRLGQLLEGESQLGPRFR